MCVPVMIVDDNVVEDAEEFFTLALFSILSHVTNDPFDATVSILDNDGKMNYTVSVLVTT